MDEWLAYINAKCYWSLCNGKRQSDFFRQCVYVWPTPLSIPLDENHSQNPTTKKGLARKQTADLLLKAIKDNKVNAIIGRSANFYVPYAANSPLYISFLERMLQGKAPQSLATPGTRKHNWQRKSIGGISTRFLYLWTSSITTCSTIAFNFCQNSFGSIGNSICASPITSILSIENSNLKLPVLSLFNFMKRVRLLWNGRNVKNFWIKIGKVEWEPWDGKDGTSRRKKRKTICFVKRNNINHTTVGTCLQVSFTFFNSKEIDAATSVKTIVELLKIAELKISHKNIVQVR
jgi:hypothetical protein